MRVKSAPIVLGLLAGVYMLLAAYAVIMLGSCAHAPKPAVAANAEAPFPRLENTTVAVFTSCGSGSGVLIDSTHVLTAMHVVNCLPVPFIQVPSSITVITLQGRKFVAKHDKLDMSRDLARLVIDAQPDAETLRIGRAKLKEMLCAAVAVPEPGIRCGYVAVVDGRPRAQGDVALARANAWFGNSGSGVYNEHGELVGLLVRLVWCDMADEKLWLTANIRPAKTCGAIVSSIEGLVAP